MKPRTVYIVERYGMEELLAFADFETAETVASRLLASVHKVPLMDVDSLFFDQWPHGDEEAPDGI